MSRRSSRRTSSSSVPASTESPQQQRDEADRERDGPPPKRARARRSPATRKQKGRDGEADPLSAQPSRASVSPLLDDPSSTPTVSVAGSAAADASADTRGAAARCDTDSLSIIFSFLASREFVSAASVSRRWRLAACIGTAWPPFDADRIIRQLQADDYNDSAHRRLRAKCGPQLACMLASPLCLQTNDLALVTSEFDPRELQRFTHLAAIDLTPSHQTEQFISEFVGAVQDRLQSLVLRCKAVPIVDPLSALPSWPLGRLGQLRVLVVDFQPELEQLVQLTQLECLNIESPNQFSFSLACVLRYLSTRHRLRRFSFTSPAFHVHPVPARAISALAEASWTVVQSHMPAHVLIPSVVRDAVDLPPSPLTGFDLKGQIMWPEDFSALRHLPELKRLHCEISDESIFDDSPERPPVERNFLQRLTHLRIILTCDASLCGLRECTALQSLYIVGNGPVTIDDFNAWAPSLTQLEHLRVVYSGLDAFPCAAIAACSPLTRLDLHTRRTRPNVQDIAPRLGVLPHFATLEITLYREDGLSWVLPPALLRAMIASPSWRTLHLRIRSDRGIDEWNRELSDEVLLLTPMTPAIEHLLRVSVDIKRDGLIASRIFRIARDQRGRPRWRDEDKQQNSTTQ